MLLCDGDAYVAEVAGPAVEFSRSQTLMQGASPAVEFSRSQTLMQGASRCDFCYRIDRGK
jgi:hypothetical protein